MSDRAHARRDRPPAALLRARFPGPVLEVLRRLDQAGHRSWLVGGAVRDVLLGRRRDGADFDVATPARPEAVTALFRKVIPTGLEHGTVTVITPGGPVEVTTFRGEGAYLDGRRPSSVTFLDEIEADLARRDFTVNALAYDPLDRAFCDPFGGRGDLRRRLLRAVGDPAARFAEDGLRPLRAARFAAQLDFRLDAATAAAIPAALPVAAQVAAERVADELSRLLEAAHPRPGLEVLEASGLIAVVLPALGGLRAVERAHAYATASAVGADLTLRAAALLHVLAVPGAPEGVGARVRTVLAGLRFPGQVADGAATLIARHGCLLSAHRPPPPGRKVEARRWLSALGPSRLPAVLELWEADARALSASRSTRARRELREFRALLSRVRRERPPLSVAELKLDGRAVMEILAVPAGPAVGEALRHLLDRVLEDPHLNTAAALASELRAWWRARTG